MGIRIGNVPTSTLNDTDNILFAEGEAPRKAQYSEMKADIIGSATLLTNADKPKEAINELVQDLLDSVGYGVISGGAVLAQSTPNMTVQVTACTYTTSTGARKTAIANSSLTVAVADTTNARIDAIYINSSGVISYLQGTAAVSPVAPTTPTGGTLLAQINVAANQTTITNSNITDQRKLLISTDWLNSQLSDKVNKTSIANNLTTTVAGSVLDATQGKILQDSINTKANISYESPIVPTMLNSWVNYGGAYSKVGYWKDSLGNVHLKGLIKSGVMSNAAFILPVGYRPLLTLNIPSQSANSFALIAIASDGTVTPAVGTNTSISLDGITFKAGV